MPLKRVIICICTHQIDKKVWLSMRYLSPASLGKMPFRVGPLLTCLISTLLGLTGSRHSHTLPLGLWQSCCTTLTPHLHPYYVTCSPCLCLLYNFEYLMVPVFGSQISCLHVDLLPDHTLSSVYPAFLCQVSLTMLVHFLALQRIYIRKFYLYAFILLYTHPFVPYLTDYMF